MRCWQSPPRVSPYPDFVSGAHKQGLALAGFKGEWRDTAERRSIRGVVLAAKIICNTLN